MNRPIGDESVRETGCSARWGTPTPRTWYPDDEPQETMSPVTYGATLLAQQTLTPPPGGKNREDAY